MNLGVGMAGFYGLELDTEGIIRVWYMGQVAAIVSSKGTILMIRKGVPVYLVEYLLLQPRLEKTQWN